MANFTITPSTGIGQTTVSATNLSQNLTYEKRTALVTITDGNTTKVVTLVQGALPHCEQNSQYFSAATIGSTGGSVAFNIITDYDTNLVCFSGENQSVYTLKDETTNTVIPFISGSSINFMGDEVFSPNSSHTYSLTVTANSGAERTDAFRMYHFVWSGDRYVLAPYYYDMYITVQSSANTWYTINAPDLIIPWSATSGSVLITKQPKEVSLRVDDNTDFGGADSNFPYINYFNDFVSEEEPETAMPNGQFLWFGDATAQTCYAWVKEINSGTTDKTATVGIYSGRTGGSQQLTTFNIIQQGQDLFSGSTYNIGTNYVSSPTTYFAQFNCVVNEPVWAEVTQEFSIGANIYDTKFGTGNITQISNAMTAGVIPTGTTLLNLFCGRKSTTSAGSNYMYGKIKFYSYRNNVKGPQIWELTMVVYQ